MGWRSRPDDYQKQAVINAREAYKQGFKAPLIVGATGSGKTDILSLMAKVSTLKSKDNRIGVAVHREEIIEQIVERMEQHYELSPGIIKSGYPLQLNRQVQVVSTNTFYHKPHIFNPVLWICDEAHHFNETNKTYNFMMKSRFRCGLTATPERPDGKDLSGVFDTIIHPITTQELIRRKRIVDVKVLHPLGGPDLTKVKVSGKDYNQKQLWEQFNNEGLFRKVVDVYKEHAPNLKGIVYCVNVEHAKIQAEIFNKNGIKAAVLHGKTPSEEREAIINGYRYGSIQVLCNFGIVSEGFDVPECDVVVFATKTKSIVKWYQGVGRCMRFREGKTHGLVIDFGGNIFQKHLTLPKYYDINGFELVKPKRPKLPPTMKLCPDCRFAVLSSVMVCPGCGHKFKAAPKKYKFDISRIPMVVLKDYRAFEMRVLNLKGPALSGYPLSQLRAIATIKGYKSGWLMKTLIRRKYVGAGFKNYAAMNQILMQAEKRDGTSEMYLYFKSRDIE